MFRILLALMLCLASPVTAQTSDQPTGTISVAESAQQDAAIATRIRTILAELEGYEDVTVTVSSGIVTLRGTTIEPVGSRAWWPSETR
jgi:ABC-type proline/glycine betaine transport system substrate-binding protein